jgi:hypothetical protein
MRLSKHYAITNRYGVVSITPLGTRNPAAHAAARIEFEFFLEVSTKGAMDDMFVRMHRVYAIRGAYDDSLD